MVAASKRLLEEVRKSAIKDEVFAMRIRGRLVVPPVASTAKKPKGSG